MAFAITLRGTAASVASQQTQNIGAFTPSANSELFVVASAVHTTTPGSPTISDGLGSTYSSVQNGSFNSTNRMRVFRTSIGGSPASMTPQVDWGATYNNLAMIIFEITGHDTVTPIVLGSNIVANGGSDTTPAAGSAPALANAANMQLLFCQSRRDGNNTSPEAGWTELKDIGTAAASNALVVNYIIGAYDSTPTCTLSGSALWRCGAVEIAIASSVSGGGAWYYSTQQG